MDKARLAWDNSLNKYQFQYFDDEGALQTGGWGSIAELSFDTENNISSLVVSKVECDSIEGGVIGQLQSDLQPFWCAGKFLTDGTVPAASRKGIHGATFTVVRTSEGNYTVTMPAHPDGADYVLLVSGKTYHLPVFQDSSTVFRITPKSAGNAAEDADVNFAVLA